MTATGASTGQPLSDQKLEVGHVLFMDIVGYSILNIEEQKRIVEALQEVVRGTDEFQHASAEGRVRPLPTGDRMALVFFVDPEAPLRCAVEISRALRLIPAIRLRMGIHAGPVYKVGDINTNLNVAGGGVNIAQRVMDCGDAGHILVSEETAHFFAQVGNWAKSLHDVGNTRVKHGVRLHWRMTKLTVSRFFLRNQWIARGESEIVPLVMSLNSPLLHGSHLRRRVKDMPACPMTTLHFFGAATFAVARSSGFPATWASLALRRLRAPLISWIFSWIPALVLFSTAPGFTR